MDVGIPELFHGDSQPEGNARKDAPQVFYIITTHELGVDVGVVGEKQFVRALEAGRGRE